MLSTSIQERQFVYSTDDAITLCSDFDSVCREAAQDKLSGSALRAVDDHLWDLTNAICARIDSLPGEILAHFRELHFEPKVLRWYLLNPRVASLWEKPAGYSGDYSTIEEICQNIQTWNSFEDVFRNHLLRSRMAEQHRSKIKEQAQFASSILSRPGAKLLDAGCGPCFDLRLAISEGCCIDNADITLIDLDQHALSFARKRLTQASGDLAIQCVNGDLCSAMRHLLKGARGAYSGILFGGIFDYLPDRVVVHVLRIARQMLTPDGELFFSQVSTSNPERTFMKWYGDWVLTERDEDSLHRLCLQAGFDSCEGSLHRERQGITIVGRIKPCEKG